MATLFTRIIEGELPGRFVWRDDHAVAFLTINPIRPGHTLIVPRREIDHWIDLEPELTAHLMLVSQKLSRVLQRAWSPAKVGLMIAGLEVPHVHLHVLPIWGLGDMNFSAADPDPRPADLDEAAEMIRRGLRQDGHPEVSD